MATSIIMGLSMLLAVVLMARAASDDATRLGCDRDLATVERLDGDREPLAARIAEIDMARDRLDAYCPHVSHRRRALSSESTAAEYEVGEVAALVSAFSDATAANAVGSVLVNAASEGAAWGLTAELHLDANRRMVVLNSTNAWLQSLGPHRLITVATGSALSMSGFKLTGGAQYGTRGDGSDPNGQGGCVCVRGGATFRATRTTFENCTAAMGGAVYGGPGSSMVLENVLIVRCVADFIGGGVAGPELATVEIRGGSRFISCSSGYGGGGLALFEPVALFSSGILSDVSMDNCTAINFGGSLLGPGLGLLTTRNLRLSNSAAGVGGGIAHFNGDSSHVGCRIDRCFSVGTSPVDGGGGIFGFAFGGIPSSFTFGEGSSITNCAAASFGGGIVTQALQACVMERGAYISDCTAENGGGGVCSKGRLELRRSARIFRCTAGSFGGAVFVNQLGESATFNDAVLSHNVVSDGGGGGAIAMPKDARVFILRSEISFNTALSGVGGAIASSGGQVWLMAGSVLKSNIALSGGALAFSVDFNPLWASGVANGRLFASGPRCLFLSVRVNFEQVTDVTASGMTYTLLSDALTSSVVDVRGERSMSVPVTGGTFESNLCLQPDREYALDIVAMRGGADWSGATVKSFGPVLAEGLSADDADYATPTGEEVPGFATHHLVRMEQNVGSRVLIEGNVASGQGGGLYVSELAQIFAFETSFSQNVALKNGGAAFLGTSTRFEAVETQFSGNRARGSGGGLCATADGRVNLTDVTATNNSAAAGGGFGLFDGPASVTVSRSSFQRNHVASSYDEEFFGCGGGALSFASVPFARLSETIFESNYNELSDGGALYTAGSSVVTLEGVVFANNSAHLGNGGAVAVSAGSVTWTAPEDLCATAEVLVDYSGTVEHCGQSTASFQWDNCDNAPDRCERLRDSDNPYVTDRSVNYCAGCACPFDALKHFIVKNDDDGGGEVAIFDKVKSVWDPRGVGVAGSVVAYAICLKAGNYSLKAYDLLGQGWWGARLKIHVHQHGTFEEYAVENAPWTTESSTVEFTVARTAPSVARNVIKGNSALNGGGGAVYWQSFAQPAGLSTTLLQENDASYGPDLATQAYQVSYRGIINGGLQVALLDFYGDVVRSQSLTVVLTSVFSTQKIMLRGMADFSEFAPADNSTGSLSAVSFSLPALGLVSPPISLRCAVGYRDDPDLSCKPCDDSEYWSLNAAGNGECKLCEPGMHCGPSTTLSERLLPNIRARRRWWRRDETATKFYLCPYRKGCKPGNSTGPDACKDGYAGPACSVCKNGFYADTSHTSGSCKECNGKSKAVVIVVGLLVLFLGIAFLGCAGYWVRHSGVGKVARLVRLQQNKPRAIIMYVNWQIISSAEESLETLFPEPQRQLIAALSIFEFKLDILPVACVATYSYYEEVLSASLTPISIFLAMKLWSSWKYFFVKSDELKRIQTLHRKVMIIAMFFLYPTSSASVLKIWRGCEKYQRADEDGYLKVDLSKRCGTPTHTAYLIYASLMVAIIAAGWPLYLICLLFSYRKRIYPPAKNDAERLRVRAKDTALGEGGLEACFEHFRPGVIYAVPCEMTRRAFMIGILPFCGEGGLRVFIGLMVCLGYLATLREVQPYAEKDTNLLAYAASWVVFTVFLAAFIIQTRPFGYQDYSLGVGLVLVTCSMLFMVVFFGLRTNKVEREAVVMQFELELRDREANADIAALKSARDRLRQKYEPDRMQREVEAQKLVTCQRALKRFKQPCTLKNVDIDTSHHFLHLPHLPSTSPRKLLHRSSKLGHHAGDHVSFTASHYPCYVVGLSTLRTFESLPAHEDALQHEQLRVLTALSATPNSASSYFISQNWETFGDSPHPDNEKQTKLRWLKNLDKHMGLEALELELHIWWDRISIPQRNPCEQKAAIASLCCYTQLCTRFVALVRDQVAWKELHDEDLRDPTGQYPVAGALETYLSRGWCRLEIVAALAPKKMPSGAWRPGPRTMTIRYHHDPIDNGIGPTIDSELLMNPLEGIFTVDSDAQVITPVLKCIADRYDEYDKSGSDAWAVTINVKNRPEWLKNFSEKSSKIKREEPQTGEEEEDAKVFDGDGDASSPTSPDAEIKPFTGAHHQRSDEAHARVSHDAMLTGPNPEADGTMSPPLKVKFTAIAPTTADPKDDDDDDEAKNHPL